MSLVGLLVFVCVVAVVLYLVSLLPGDARLLNIVRVIVIVIALVYLLEALGVLAGGPTLRLH